MRIDKVVENNLCISCGICAGICPVQAIDVSYQEGMYVPKISDEKCTDCGLCGQMCPGKGCDYTNLYGITGQELPYDFFSGNHEGVFVLRSKDEVWLKNSSSGGVVSQLVHDLLKDRLYESAFLVDTYYYGEEVFTHRYESLKSNEEIAKSRYIPVNQREAVHYMLHNRKERVILVGTSCFIQGIQQIIEKMQLDRKNYFLIGLFCDKTMSYRVWDYFQHMAGKEKLLKLHFRNKASGGWPGNMMLYLSRKGEHPLPRGRRMEVKEYFCPERCLYCLDKLNQFADISVGDNYTGEHSEKAGSSSVIVRSQTGKEILQRYANSFVIGDSSMEAVKKSQGIYQRRYNYFWGICKSEQVGYPINVMPNSCIPSQENLPDIQKRYDILRKKIDLGRKGDFLGIRKAVFRRRIRSLMGTIRRRILKCFASNSQI